MATLIYILLLIAYFLLGYFIKYKNCFKAFILLSFALPFTNFTSDFHTKYQVSVYLLFFVGALLRVIPNLNYKDALSRLNKPTLYAFIGIGILFIIYLPLTINHGLIDILKDLKPYLYLGLLVLFLNEYLDYARNAISNNFILKCLQINCVIAVLFYTAMYLFDLHLLLIDDPYFKNNELRYTNLASYCIPFLFLKNIVTSKKIRLDEGFYMLIPMLLTGNRTIILVSAFTALVYLFMKWNLKSKIGALLVSPLIMGGLYFILSTFNDNSSLSRFKKLFNLDYLSHAISTRLEPLILSFKDYQFYNYFIGNGFGHTYYIPWFEYREQISNYNIYLDNLYATLFGKFGILFFVPILFFIVLLKKYSSPEIFKYLLLYFLLLGLTNSFIYQPYLPWFMFIMAISLEKTTVKS